LISASFTATQFAYPAAVVEYIPADINTKTKVRTMDDFFILKLYAVEQKFLVWEY
jgi:hypothetical protein